MVRRFPLLPSVVQLEAAASSYSVITFGGEVDDDDDVYPDLPIPIRLVSYPYSTIASPASTTLHSTNPITCQRYRGQCGHCTRPPAGDKTTPPGMPLWPPTQAPGCPSLEDTPPTTAAAAKCTSARQRVALLRAGGGIDSARSPCGPRPSQVLGRRALIFISDSACVTAPTHCPGTLARRLGASCNWQQPN
jgi:hypothetical protein